MSSKSYMLVVKGTDEATAVLAFESRFHHQRGWYTIGHTQKFGDFEQIMLHVKLNVETGHEAAWVEGELNYWFTHSLPGKPGSGLSYGSLLYWTELTEGMTLGYSPEAADRGPIF
jgi:hypothetical protein